MKQRRSKVSWISSTQVRCLSQTWYRDSNLDNKFVQFRFPNWKVCFDKQSPSSIFSLISSLQIMNRVLCLSCFSYFHLFCVVQLQMKRTKVLTHTRTLWTTNRTGFKREFYLIKTFKIFNKVQNIQFNANIDQRKQKYTWLPPWFANHF